MSTTRYPRFPSPHAPPQPNDNSFLNTDHRIGMVFDDDKLPSAAKTTRRAKKQDVNILRKKCAPRQYVSKHFNQSKPIRKLTTRTRLPTRIDEVQHVDDELEKANGSPEPSDQPKISRIYYGLNVDELSSDSDLTDVPEDIGPDPFTTNPTKVLAVKARKKSHTNSRSPYFPDEPRHKQRPHFLTTLPFPPLSLENFGLMQEKLAHEPFKLLIATIFLNKTPGMRAMPVFYDLMKKYPTPEDLANARVEDVTEMIRHLGFQNQRARKCIAMAKKWTQQPPIKGKRYRKLHYPKKGDGRDVKEDEVVDDQDPRVAWEISHLPGLGPYSHDSWRMFCRDELQGHSSDWLGSGTAKGFEPEWKRVLPTDKELRAYMTWIWLKEGWMWNKETGERTKADEELLVIAQHGGVVQEPMDQAHLLVRKLDIDTIFDHPHVETPAGDFIP